MLVDEESPFSGFSFHNFLGNSDTITVIYTNIIQASEGEMEPSCAKGLIERVGIKPTSFKTSVAHP
jgi:hypothetical protein